MEAVRMTRMAKIYGDSVMKGTIIDAAYRYHAVMEEYIKKFKTKFMLETENRSRFGITVDKGYKFVKNDIDNGDIADFAVLEFGGNDCNFKWNEIAVRPDKEHFPLTGMEEFKNTYRNMIAELKAVGTIPILMTLPPVDAERYLAFIDRNGSDGKQILRFLGDVNMIYRFQESYSNAIADIARETGCPLIDVRSCFLNKFNYRDLMCIDGVHPSREGYALIANAFENFADTRSAAKSKTA